MNEDGSHTQIEQITQMPEDGFVRNGQHRPFCKISNHDEGMFGKGK